MFLTKLIMFLAAIFSSHKNQNTNIGHMNMAKFILNQNLSKEYQAKVDALDLILEKDPNNIEVLLNKAFYFLYDHVDGKAIAIYKRILELDPNCVDAYFWWSQLLLSNWQCEEEVEPILKEALELAPNRADIYFLLADVYYYTDNDKRAYNLKRAIELEPTWLLPRIYLVDYFLGIKDTTSARKELDEVNALFDENFPIPEGEMQKYYECFITGRLNRKCCLEHCEDILSGKIPHYKNEKEILTIDLKAKMEEDNQVLSEKITTKPQE